MDAPLCGTTLTGTKIQTLFSKSTSVTMNGHALAAVDAEPLGEQGYTSTVMRAKLTWSSPDHKSKNDDLPKSVIIKVIGSDSVISQFDPSAQKKAKEVRIPHNVECLAYTLEGLHDHVPMPKCFGYQLDTLTESGIIILEDLSERAALLPGMKIFGEGVNMEQLENLLKTLADLHAWSVNTSIDWKKSIPTLDQNPSLAGFMADMIRLLPETKKAFPGLFERLDPEKLKAYLSSENFLKIFGSDPKTRYNMPLVLVHGDIHALNMLFEKTPEGRVGNRLAALLDWQLAHPGCGAEDLARVLGWVVSTNRRKDLEDHVISRYVQLFNQKVRTSEHHVRVDDVRKATQEMFYFNSIAFGCALIPVSTLPTKISDLSKMEKEKVKEDVIFRHSTNFRDALEVLGW